MIVAIFGTSIETEFSEDLNHLFLLLKKKKLKVFMYAPFYDFVKSNCKIQPELDGLFTSGEDLPDRVKLLFSIGGDGTFLKSVLALRNKSIPVVGINLGRLGFLSDISKEDADQAIDLILNKKYEIEKRSVLQVQGHNGLFGDFNYALNEITVTKLDTSAMINIHTYLDDNYLNTYWADGLIVSTPTGSTAYSLSVGGPILTPDSHNFIISPIAPHNLTVRPIVVPDEYTIKLKVEGRGSQFLASLDSRSKAIDFPGELYIHMADFNVKTLKLDGHSFFSTLRNKLMWGVDRRN